MSSLQDIYSISERVRGSLVIKVIDLDGNITQEIHDHNFIVDNAAVILAKLLGGFIGPITKLGVGTGYTEPVPGDTELTELLSVLMENIDFVSTPGSCIFTGQIDYEDFNGTVIREYGLLTEQDSLFSRKTRASITKDASMSILVTWTIKFT